MVADAEAVVLPGDGAFDDVMSGLARLGLIDPLRAVLEEGRPFFGICIGYQILFSESEEFDQVKGLDVIPGVVRRFPAGPKVPHMGWNNVEHRGDLALFDGVPSGAHFYFVHSYYPETDDASLKRATCDYGVTLRRRGGARRALRHPVPPGEEPALGAAPAGELRRLRAKPAALTWPSR